MKSILGAVAVGFLFAAGFYLQKKLMAEPIDNWLGKRDAEKLARKAYAVQAAGACHVAPPAPPVV